MTKTPLTEFAKLVLTMLDEPNRAQREQLEVIVRAKAKAAIR